MRNSTGMDANTLEWALVPEIIGTIRQQAITWAIVDWYICRDLASLKGNSF